MHDPSPDRGPPPPPARGPGRPRMAEDVGLKMRNIWFAFMRMHGMSHEQIATAEDVSVKTVARALADAARYPRQLRRRRREAERHDEAEA